MRSNVSLKRRRRGALEDAVRLQRLMQPQQIGVGQRRGELRNKRSIDAVYVRPGHRGQTRMKPHANGAGSRYR
jgi:hypothetical protein